MKREIAGHQIEVTNYPRTQQARLIVGLVDNPLERIMLEREAKRVKVQIAAQRWIESDGQDYNALAILTANVPPKFAGPSCYAAGLYKGGRR